MHTPTTHPPQADDVKQSGDRPNSDVSPPEAVQLHRKIDASFFAIEEAWWKWVNDNCPSSSPRARGKWMRENTFTYDGTVWTRTSVAYRSNSGKTIMDRATSFHSEDGRTIELGAGKLNRRNDADRNWGLGPE